MAINNSFDNSSINIYFHMKNHYKKLRSARSTIDNSFPQGFVKTFSTPPSSGRSLKRASFEERNIKYDQHLSNHSGITQKHNCITSTSGTRDTMSINTINLPLRPKSRKNTLEIPSKMQCKLRSQQSMDPSSKKAISDRAKKKSRRVQGRNLNTNGKSTNKINTAAVIEYKSVNEDPDKSDTNQSVTSKEVEYKTSKPRVEEHEYLQFLLRITEDIIINNLYTNEDIDQVFQEHVEANKDHLNVTKMKAQLARLCLELEIPYKNEGNVKNVECYDKFFEHSYAANCDPKLEDCECTAKRTLNIDTKENRNKVKNGENEQNIEFELQTIFNILSNKNSLGRVTERTEPNSLDTLIESVKETSKASVLSLANVTVFPCFENVESCDINSKENLFKNEELGSTEEKALHDKPDLTEKEKLGCVEEEILFQKWKDNLVNEVTNNIQIDEAENQNTEIEDTISIDENKKVETNNSPLANITEDELLTVEMNQVKEKSYNYLSFIDNDINKLVENLSNSSLNNEESGVLEDLSHHSIKNSDKGEGLGEDVSPIIKYERNQTKCDAENIGLIKDNKELDQIVVRGNMLKVTNDQYTQINLTHSDKECNTTIYLNEYPKSEYILINGPIYVLKSILDSQDKLIIYGKVDAQKDIPTVSEEMGPEKLCSVKEKPVPTHDTMFQTQPKFDYVSSYFSDDYSKLLNSDYDLMPQRDSNISIKYHHLLVDATTSISNVNLHNTGGNIFPNPEALLLSDKYELHAQLQDQENLIPETDNLTKHHVLDKNVFNFQNELSMDEQYELKSYSLPKEVNGSVNISGYSVTREAEVLEQMPELDVSLKSLGLCSPNITKESDVSRDVSESGEIARANIYAEEELSQASTFRSDKERNSNILSPNRKNILGKRKLKHPT